MCFALPVGGRRTEAICLPDYRGLTPQAIFPPGFPGRFTLSTDGNRGNRMGSEPVIGRCSVWKDAYVGQLDRS